MHAALSVSIFEQFEELTDGLFTRAEGESEGGATASADAPTAKQIDGLAASAGSDEESGGPAQGLLAEHSTREDSTSRAARYETVSAILATREEMLARFLAARNAEAEE